MKLKLLTLILLTTATAALCACNDGQTGGQNLNDQPDTRMTEENDGQETVPDDGIECPDDRCPEGPCPDGRHPDGRRRDEPRPPKHGDDRRPKRIFGDRRERGTDGCGEETPGEKPEILPAPEN